MTTGDRSNLVESEDRFRLMFEQAGVAMVAVDLAGYVVAWNHGAAHMFGAGAEEMTGTHWSHLVPLDEREEAATHFELCLQEGRSSEFEFMMRDEHGRVRRLATIVTPVRLADGASAGGLACVRDITNRMILEQRLAHQSKMASLGEMAGALSHHFNNVLGGVVTSVDFALASDDPQVLARVMEKTATSLSRATGLVENLLAFAQGDFRDATLCELGEVIIDLIARSEVKLEATSIGFEVDLETIPVVEVPRAAMQTVLGNLVDNAIEAMPRGGMLKIALGADTDNVFVRISDTGCGLDEESLTRIFEPFYSTKKKEDVGKLGQGLGLAVAHGILKVLHGSVHVSSILGEGTTLEVRLPLRKDP